MGKTQQVVLELAGREVVITANFDLTWGDEGPVNHSDHRAVGLATLDACRDAANSWLFPDAGPAWHGIRAIYVAATGNPSHYVERAKKKLAGSPSGVGLRHRGGLAGSAGFSSARRGATR